MGDLLRARVDRVGFHPVPDAFTICPWVDFQGHINCFSKQCSVTCLAKDRGRLMTGLGQRTLDMEFAHVEEVRPSPRAFADS